MTSVQALGHDRALADVLGLAEGSPRPPGRLLADDVRMWHASPEQGLTAAIDELSGAEACAEALARLAPSRLTVLTSVRSGWACWAEVARRGDGEPETCLVGLSYAPGGRVSRLVWLRAPFVALCQVEPGDRVFEPRPILEAYFTALMNSRFGEAAACFTPDTLYSHPPYAGGNKRVLFRGRDALQDGFETQRGPSPVRQIITDLWHAGSRVFVEGIIEGISDGGTFFSTADINREREIARYVAFYSATRIPRAR